MLLSISFILLVGMSVGWICQKMTLPSLLGMLVTGMVLGPYVRAKKLEDLLYSCVLFLQALNFWVAYCTSRSICYGFVYIKS